MKLLKVLRLTGVFLVLCSQAGADTLYRCETDVAAFSPGGGGQYFVVDSAVDAADRMVVVYMKTSTSSLMLDACLDSACASKVTTVLATDVRAISTDVNVLLRPSDRRPVITFADGLGASTGVRLVVCEDVTCTTRSTRVITNTSSLTQNIQPVVGLSNGRPFVAYYNQRLELYRCADSECSAGSLRTVDATVRSGFYPSIAVGSDGVPVISHLRNNTPGVAHIYRCADGNCATGSTILTRTFARPPLYSHIALRDGSIPVIAHTLYEANPPGVDSLHVYTCHDAACTTGSASPPSVAPGRIRVTDLSLRPNGLAFITYASDADTKIYFNQCHDQFCQSSSTGIVASFAAGRVGHTLSVLSDGTAIILHTAPGNDDVALTRCSQPSNELFKDGFEVEWLR